MLIIEDKDEKIFARFNLFEGDSKENKLGKVLERLFLADLVVVLISLEKQSLEALKSDANLQFDFEDEDDLALLNHSKLYFYLYMD